MDEGFGEMETFVCRDCGTQVYFTGGRLKLYQDETGEYDRCLDCRLERMEQASEKRMEAFERDESEDRDAI